MKIVNNTVLSAAFLICLSALPGYCFPLLSFGGSIGGTINVAGFGASQALQSNFSLSGYNSLTVIGAPQNNATYVLTNTALNYDIASRTLTLLGAISSIPGLTTQTALLTATYAAGLTADNNAGTHQAVTVNFNNSTTLTESATLLNFLGFTAASTSVAWFGGPAVGGTGSGVPSGSTYSYTANSASLATTAAATPEPMSFALIGGGLFLIGLARKVRKT